MRERMLAWCHPLLITLAGLFLLAFLFVAVGRIGYPYELEWMEGGSLQHVEQLRSGGTIYAEPSLHFIPFIYTPFYYFLAAPLTLILGNGFLPLRLVSLFATLATFWLIYLAIRKEGGTVSSGWIACGLYAATFELAGAWFDIGRVDSLMVFLLLAGCLLLRHSSKGKTAFFAGIVLGLGFFTKQTVLVAVMPVLAWEVLIRRRQGLACLAGFAGWIVISTSACQLWTDGWYKYYVFDLPRQHAIARDFVVGFWASDLAWSIPVFLLLSAWALVTGLRAWGQAEGRYRGGFYLVLLIGWLGASWLSRLHTGGYANVLMPAYLALSLVAGLGCSEVQQRRPRRWPLVSLVLAIQLAFLLYSPLGHLPSSEDRAAGDRIVEQLRQLDGEVLVPYHGYLALLAGKTASAHHMAMSDIERASDGSHWQKLRAEYEQAISARRYAGILMSVRNWFGDQLEGTYRESVDFFADPQDRTFRPPAGKPPYRPRWLYRPVLPVVALPE